MYRHRTYRGRMLCPCTSPALSALFARSTHRQRKPSLCTPLALPGLGTGPPGSSCTSPDSFVLARETCRARMPRPCSPSWQSRLGACPMDRSHTPQPQPKSPTRPCDICLQRMLRKRLAPQSFDTCLLHTHCSFGLRCWAGICLGCKTYTTPTLSALLARNICQQHTIRPCSSSAPPHLDAGQRDNSRTTQAPPVPHQQRIYPRCMLFPCK